MHLRKTKLFIGVLSLVFLLSLFFLFRNPKEKQGFCVVLPFLGITPSGVPCFNVNVEGRDLVLELDLGFSGYIGINSSSISQIENKVFVETKSMYGWKGDQYLENIYEIPQVKMNEITFNRILLNEESLNFLFDATISEKRDLLDSSIPLIKQIDGRLGWKMFEKSNLFLDFKNARIIFCDSIDTLKSNGISLENFVKTPFSLARGIIEIEVLLQDKLRNCLLDTGFTWNVLPTNTSLDKPSFSSSLIIQDKDLGETQFHYLPLKMPIAVDAVLGMDFFSTHQVFIDFSQNQILCERDF